MRRFVRFCSNHNRRGRPPQIYLARRSPTQPYHRCYARTNSSADCSGSSQSGQNTPYGSTLRPLRPPSYRLSIQQLAAGARRNATGMPRAAEKRSRSCAVPRSLKWQVPVRHRSLDKPIVDGVRDRMRAIISALEAEGFSISAPWKMAGWFVDHRCWLMDRSCLSRDAQAEAL